MISYSVVETIVPRGGSRYGAGRPANKRKAEASTSIDVRVLARKGLLSAGAHYLWSWTTNYGDKAGSVNIQVKDSSPRIVVSYQWTPHGYDPRYIENSLFINRTDCNYGGSRPWFVCPECNGRCAIVYFGARGGKYGCRKCVGITYYSQSGDLIDRAWRKQRKLEILLDDDGNRIKGMHWQTYHRIIERIIECENIKDLAISAMINRFGFEY